ncbi:MAG: NAD(P)/FAD-dependent oxidoreductase [Acidimicrobiia bacterium]|nr:NAD(P)/FAD-dependent oxidoreductase [Acidimicrobiia bacterium]MCY4457742.1 NAD(P)/FAD-dependent oxidoreductase [Acidimicrobiaceae bacterium]
MNGVPCTAPESQVVVIGAGPAGLTAAYQLGKADQQVTVLEADDVVGGISRTVNRDGWRFDIGGHRFFTKVSAVSELWHEILNSEEFITRPRMSRIFYQGKFYDYPLKPFNALANLGVIEAARCVLSYVWVKLRPPKNQTKFEGYVAAKFGWRLYRTFFKTYTEKVWGVRADQIEADWAAQRIKNLNLMNAVTSAFKPRSKSSEITTLIDQFWYPQLGPGMMWERCAELVQQQGNSIELNAPVTTVHHANGLATAVVSSSDNGTHAHRCDAVISSMPLAQLVQAMDPPAPLAVHRAAAQLKFRDFLTVALVVPKEDGFPDNWIYIHSPEVTVGRVQNFGSWSADLVPDENKTCLGLEFFVNAGTELWDADDAELIALATSEMEILNLLDPNRVERGFVVRMPKAYPIYDASYKANVNILRGWLSEVARNVHPVGRNGMHRYNNQDHSMYTAMLTVENLLNGTKHDVWNVNVDADYHEAQAKGAAVGG